MKVTNRSHSVVRQQHFCIQFTTYSQYEAEEASFYICHDKTAYCTSTDLLRRTYMVVVIQTDTHLYKL